MENLGRVNYGKYIFDRKVMLQTGHLSDSHTFNLHIVFLLYLHLNAGLRSKMHGFSICLSCFGTFDTQVFISYENFFRHC